MNREGTEIDWQYKHHLNAAGLDDLPAVQSMWRVISFLRVVVDFQAIATLYLEEPSARVRVEVDPGMLPREDFGRP